MYFTGVARGCGWQRLATVINLGTFYLIGMPISVLCGFKLKLHAKVNVRLSYEIFKRFLLLLNCV